MNIETEGDDGGAKMLPSPNEVLNQSKMSMGQWLVVIICILAMALDGYDVMSIALAASELKAEWDLSKAQLGLILPLEFLGMAIGAIFMGRMSDTVGRRFIMLVCLLIITGGMLVSGMAQSMGVMGGSRVFTGLGIGGLLASATAMSSEYSNDKNRSLCVTLIAGGYTFGVFIASKLSGVLLEVGSWRDIFKFGALMSVVFVPIVFFFVPESISLLEQKKSDKANDQIDKTLKRFGHTKQYKVTTEFAVGEIIKPSQLFKGSVGKITTLMIFFYCSQIATYYFFIKWVPPEVVDLGYTKLQGTEILATISLTGLLGSFAIAFLTKIFPLKNLMIISLIGAGISVVAFPFSTGSMETMHIVAGIAGFWFYGVISGGFGMFALAFPPRVLASGSGLVLGTGRGGAMIGPWLAGVLFTAGMTIFTVFPLMAIGSFVAVIALILLPKNVEHG